MIAVVEASTARATSPREGSVERLASIASGRIMPMRVWPASVYTEIRQGRAMLSAIGAEHRSGLLGVAHLEDAALLRERQAFAAQGIAQIMHGQHAEALVQHRLLEGGTGLLEGFRRVEDEEGIHGWRQGVPYQLRYHWDICWISSLCTRTMACCN